MRKKVLTTASRSALMKRIRRERTAPEDEVAQLLRELGIRARRNVRGLPGSPDFANQSRKIAIFVHGCFWHAHPNCKRATLPKSNRSFWQVKLLANQIRDRAKIRALKRKGFSVVVIWQCSIEKPATRKALAAAGRGRASEPIAT